MHTAVSWIGFLLAQHCFLRCDTLVGLKEMTSEFIQIGSCWLLFPLQAVLGNVFLQYDSWELLYKVENKRRGTTQFVINNQKCSHEFTVVPTWRLTKSQLSEQLSSLAWKCLFFFLPQIAERRDRLSQQVLKKAARKQACHEQCLDWQESKGQKRAQSSVYENRPKGRSAPYYPLCNGS